MKSNNAMSAVVDTFIAPTKAFNGLKEAKGWAWLAFLLIVLLAAGANYYYFSAVDANFLVSEQLAQMEAKGSTPAEIEQAKGFIAQQVPMMGIISAVGAVFAMLIFNAIFALYYFFVGKMDEQNDATYGDWFGFSVFTFLPSILNSIGVVALVATASTADIPLSTMSFASLNQLIFDLPLSNSFYTMLESLNLFSIWAIALTFVGMKAWTNFNTAKAAVFALLPTVIIYGIWGLIAAS